MKYLESVPADDRIFARRLEPSRKEPGYGSSQQHVRTVDISDPIEHEFQSIYFDTPLQHALIRSVVRIGLSPDKRASTELTAERKEKVRNDPTLWKLCERRERHMRKIDGRLRLLPSWNS